MILPKLMAGSYGTLAALEEVTVKVLPRPEAACTVLLCGLPPAAAMRAMTARSGSPHEVSGAAYLPESATAALTSAPDLPGVAALRLEGPAASVAYRREQLLAAFSSEGEAAVLHDDASLNFWQAIRDVAPFVHTPERAVWRISVAASARRRNRRGGRAPARRRLVSRLGRRHLWAAVAEEEDGGAAVIRKVLRGPNGHGSDMRP